jgi:hypothetical protein
VLWLLPEGGTKIPRVRKLPLRVADEAEALYRSGKTMMATAAELGVSFSTVRRALVIKGVEPRHSGWTWSKQPKQKGERAESA